MQQEPLLKKEQEAQNTDISETILNNVTPQDKEKNTVLLNEAIEDFLNKTPGIIKTQFWNSTFHEKPETEISSYLDSGTGSYLGPTGTSIMLGVAVLLTIIARVLSDGLAPVFVAFGSLFIVPTLTVISAKTWAYKTGLINKFNIFNKTKEQDNSRDVKIISFVSMLLNNSNYEKYTKTDLVKKKEILDETFSIIASKKDKNIKKFLNKLITQNIVGYRKNQNQNELKKKENSFNDFLKEVSLDDFQKRQREIINNLILGEKREFTPIENKLSTQENAFTDDRFLNVSLPVHSALEDLQNKEVQLLSKYEKKFIYKFASKNNKSKDQFTNLTSIFEHLQFLSIFPLIIGTCFAFYPIDFIVKNGLSGISNVSGGTLIALTFTILSFWFAFANVSMLYTIYKKFCFGFFNNLPAKNENENLLNNLIVFTLFLNMPFNQSLSKEDKLKEFNNFKDKLILKKNSDEFFATHITNLYHENFSKYYNEATQQNKKSLEKIQIELLKNNLQNNKELLEEANKNLLFKK